MGAEGSLGFPTPFPRHSRVTRPGLEERVGINRWDREWPGGPETQGGKPAQDHAGRGPEALRTEPAPAPRTLPPLGCRGQGGRAGLFSEIGARFQALLLQWRPRSAASGSRRTHTRGGWAIRGLPSRGPGVLSPRTPTARARLRACPRRKGQGAPGEPSSASGCSRDLRQLRPPSLGPATAPLPPRKLWRRSSTVSADWPSG